MKLWFKHLFHYHYTDELDIYHCAAETRYTYYMKCRVCGRVYSSWEDETWRYR